LVDVIVVDRERIVCRGRANIDEDPETKVITLYDGHDLVGKAYKYRRYLILHDDPKVIQEAINSGAFDDFVLARAVRLGMVPSKKKTALEQLAGLLAELAEEGG